ncbi:DUF3482 domain-containing protein [Ramlibacter algicola]|uniref:DUF3482 domain-containing protein n=1 Tax=Ramlibacter algicola TaxID=2795217 RepID=A0A934Q2D8_9BURK|nr:DUF2868 domain-containing protein [Ramlibacter algicola]MBK0393261.1 DUF3482 domain-containing protein [Ramlibacter algicola]
MPAPEPFPDRLLLPEAEARRVLFVQALEGVDTQGRLLGGEERERIEREALAASGDPARGQRVDVRAWLLARSASIVELLRHRQPRLAALADPPAWHAWAGWLLPLLALVAGGVIDRIDNPKQVNLLSPPLLAFLLWNVAVYVAIVVFAVWPRKRNAAPRAWSGWFDRPWGGVRGDVAKAFGVRWWRVAGALEGQRWRRILHTGAAAWGLGVAISLVLGGLVREYRVGWESTLLDLPQVHALLSALFAPVVALLPIEPFSQAELARLHFGSGADVGRLEARRWVGLYLALIAIVVVLPRALLAAWAAWRQHRLSRALVLDLRDPGLAAVLSRVHPVRLRVLLTIADGVDSQPAWTVLRQAGDTTAPMSVEVPWTVLSTPRGDAMVVVRTPSVAGTPETGRWWQRFMGGGDVAGPDPHAPDVVIAVAPDASAAPAIDAPLLVLATRPGHAAGALPGGPRRALLPLEALPTWRSDERLREVLQRLLPAHQQAGLARLWDRWREHALQRLSRCCGLLADDLLAHARDAQPLDVQPLGVRQLVVASEREAAQELRRTAMRELALRVQSRSDAWMARIAMLHGVKAPVAAAPDVARTDGFQVRQAVDAPQAGLAGVASGAAMGATVDLMTGGLTLGAASALGALVGGGAALVAAAWKNRAGEAVSLVLLDDGQLLALTQAALAGYVHVAHAGRAPSRSADDVLVAVKLAVDARAAALRDAFSAARSVQGDVGDTAARLAHELQAAALDALDRLHA